MCGDSVQYSSIHLVETKVSISVIRDFSQGFFTPLDCFFFPNYLIVYFLIRFSTWELLHNTLKKMMKHKAKVKEDLEDAHEKLDVLIDKAKKEVSLSLNFFIYFD